MRISDWSSDVCSSDLQRKTMKTLLITGLLAVVLSGCAVPQATRNYMADLGNGNILGATENAIEQSDEKDGEPRDLLWALEAGTLLRHNGLFERSTKTIGRASWRERGCQDV